MCANRHVVIISCDAEKSESHALGFHAKTVINDVESNQITLTHIFLDYCLLGVPQYHDDCVFFH